MDCQSDNMSAVTGEPDMKEKPLKGTNKHRINADYIHKKRPKRNKLLPAITLDVVRNPGNPSHPSARVLPKYDKTMGV